MKLTIYTNENLMESVIYYQKNDGDDVATSRPTSAVEYEIYRSLHLAINGKAGQEHVEILMKQLDYTHNFILLTELLV